MQLTSPWLKQIALMAFADKFIEHEFKAYLSYCQRTQLLFVLLSRPALDYRRNGDCGECWELWGLPRWVPSQDCSKQYRQRRESASVNKFHNLCLCEHSLLRSNKQKMLNSA